MSDIVLIYPKTGTDVKRVIAPPHSLLAIAAYPDKMGMKVKIIDQRVDDNWRETLSAELKAKPLCVGISTMTGMQIKYAMHVAQEVRKQSDTPIVWGGKHPSLLPSQTLESGLADAVCVGEGDFRFYYHVMSGNLTGIWGTPSFINIEELLPTPWHLIDVDKYIHVDMYLPDSPRTLDVGETSRGCPYQCRFCSQANEKWRPMSIEKTVDRITEAVKRFNLTGVWIRDDEFYINIKRAVAICEALIPLNIKWYTSGTRVDIFNKTPLDALEVYKQGGASVLKFGAESGSNRILDFINKGFHKEDIIEANLKAKKAGITPAYNFMGGFPTQTFDEYNETIDLIMQMKKDNSDAHFETIMTYAPMPGTYLWNVSLKYGLIPPKTLVEWINWRFDEEDETGTRNPWYTRKQRATIGNIVYLAGLTLGVPTMIDSYDGSVVGKLLKAGYYLPHKYFEYRFGHKYYTTMPELKIAKWVRKKVAYK